MKVEEIKIISSGLINHKKKNFLFSKILILYIKARIKIRFKKRLGYKPDFKNPKTYCEKLQWIKFNYIFENKSIGIKSDKYLVRFFLIKSGLEDILIPLYGVWKNFNDIDWDSMPKSFVLKINNGSGENYRWIIKDKKKVDFKKLEKEISLIMDTKYGYNYFRGEFQYSMTEKLIIAEEFLQEDGGLTDYKFYCFNGEIEFFSVENKEKERRSYFNRDWSKNSVAFYNDVPQPDQPYKKPKNFNRMLSITRKLSRGYPHIRIDLYNINGKIYFGEMTFTPENGLTQWKPRELDRVYGDLMDLDILKQHKG